MRFHRIPSTVYADDAFHSTGNNGRRYTITREESLWLLVLHTGYGNTHRRIELLTAPYVDRDHSPVILLEKHATEHEAKGGN